MSDIRVADALIPADVRNPEYSLIEGTLGRGQCGAVVAYVHLDADRAHESVGHAPHSTTEHQSLKGVLPPCRHLSRREDQASMRRLEELLLRLMTGVRRYCRTT